MITLEKLATKSFVDPKATLRDAAKVMLRTGVGAAVAVDEKGRLAFLITEFDVARAIARGEDPNVSAEDYATPSPITARPDVDALSALRIMKQYDVSHLPVVGDEVYGVAYIRDIVFSILNHVPVGKVTIEGSAKPLLEFSGKVSEAASVMVENDVEALNVNGKLFTMRNLLEAVAEGDPYADPVEKYAEEKMIVADERSDLYCALSLMKSNKVEYLVVWDKKYVSVKDLGKKVPDVVRELLRFVVLVKGRAKRGIRTVGPYDAVIIVEGEDELRKVLEEVEGEVSILVERP